MLKIALTGGIATGKSYVLEQFRRRGVPCLDADTLAHGVMAAGTEASRAIAARFGDEVLAPDGSVDRRKLGPRVFGDASARRDLEAFVHPAVRRAIAAAIRAFERFGGYSMVVVDVPLLYETGYADQFDQVILTACAPETQLQRVMQRDALTADQARQRLAAQMSTADKVTRATFVIRTDGTFEETDRAVEEVYRTLRA
jgi:dephospho-CoA kinase